jgi:hypothetical protein
VNEGDLAILKAERLRQEIRVETRKFVLRILLALAVTFGAGVLIGRFWR